MAAKQPQSSEKKAVVIPAVEKALDILEYVATQGTSVTAKEIASRLDIPASTTYRTVNYLCDRDYLKEDKQFDGRYYLGFQVMFLAHQLTRQRDLIDIAKPVMRQLATQSGQTAQLGILHDFGVVYIDQSLPAQPVNIIAALRTRIPVNVSASGKVLVANLPTPEQSHFLDHAEFAAQTPESITNKPAFMDELQQVAQQGYALDHEEYARGIGCVAAPIHGDTGQTVAAIGITGSIADYTDPMNLQRLVELTKEAAQQISHHLSR